MEFVIIYNKHYYGTAWEGDEYVGDTSEYDSMWCIFADKKLIKQGLTEAEADAFLKLLRS
jgi:hypothetical protein